MIYRKFAELLRIRRGQRAFHPKGGQAVLDAGDRVFAVARTAPDSSQQLLCLISVSDETERITVPLDDAGFAPGGTLTDLVGGGAARVESGSVSVTLDPWQVLWLSDAQ
jgi:sucrose phosphorylase